VRVWLRMAGHVRRLLRRFPPERTLRVRYEDLCTDTVGQLDRIAALAGVSRFDPPRVATFADAEHHVVGNRMRLNRDAAVTLDETWRDDLTPGDVALVLRSTAPQRRALGYA
jgi:hypothetical protein